MSSGTPFTLQSVLETRAAERQRQRLALTELLRSEVVLLTKQQQLALEIAKCDEAVRATSDRGALDVVRLSELAAHRSTLCRQSATLASDSSALTERIDLQRAKLIEADRQFRLLEKLRERRLGESRRAELRRDALNHD